MISFASFPGSACFILKRALTISLINYTLFYLLLIFISRGKDNMQCFIILIDAIIYLDIIFILFIFKLVMKSTIKV